MDAEHPLSLTLPDDLAEMVRERVAAGAYASEDEVVRAGLALLADRDATVDDWLRVRVAPAYDRARDARGMLSAAEVRQALAEGRPER